MVIHVPEDEESQLLLLNAGANECHSGNFQVRVLAARIDGLLLRSNEGKVKQGDDFGLYQLHPENQVIHVDGDVVRLTKKEFELASFLFQNADRLLSRRVLMARVWGLKSDLYTRTVDAHMSRLRKKLSLFAENGWRLVSVYGRGYQLESTQPLEQKPSVAHVSLGLPVNIKNSFHV